MNRKLLKENAKMALKQNFWMIMLVVLVAQFLGVSDINVGYNYNAGSNDWLFENFEQDSKEGDRTGNITLQTSGLQQVSAVNGHEQMMNGGISDSIFTSITALSVGIFIIIFIGILVFSVAITVFVTNPVQVGYRRFFMRNRSNQGKFVDLFSAFSSKYLNIVKGMFTTNLIIMGWTFLFIIPGIVKAYQYFFVPFILSENPDISGARAREISKKMTDGYKFQIFVLELSFIGWILLAALISVPLALLTCCLLGVGAKLVYVPLGGYMSATYAELYEERREYMLCMNQVSEELCGFYVSETLDNVIK